TGMKPATASEAFQAKKKVALKRIARDFEDQELVSKFDKFKADALELATQYTPEELALYVLSLTVQDPESLPEVEITREKPLPFKPSGGGFKGKGGRGNGRGGDRRRNDRGDRRGNRDRDDRGSRCDFKRRDDKFKKDNRRQENKKPHKNTSSEKQTGFVIRNKGDK
ncbi:ATP-dependent RNA helicase, partial [Streptococcus sp. SPC0]|nr:ATP-dependent RNA helicase [Streptococcus sp. SPC0]